MTHNLTLNQQNFDYYQVSDRGLFHRIVLHIDGITQRRQPLEGGKARACSDLSRPANASSTLNRHTCHRRVDGRQTEATGIQHNSTAQHNIYAAQRACASAPSNGARALAAALLPIAPCALHLIISNLNGGSKSCSPTRAPADPCVMWQRKNAHVYKYGA